MPCTANLGQSWFNGQDVTAAMASRFPVTFSIVMGATRLLSALLAVVLGVWAASRRGVVGQSRPGRVPSRLRDPRVPRGPGSGSGPRDQPQALQADGLPRRLTDDPGAWLSSITLPVIAPRDRRHRQRHPAGPRLRHRRTAPGTTYGPLRSRGLSRSRVIFKHVAAQRRRARPSPSSRSSSSAWFGGAVIIEQIFAIPGLGQVGVSATTPGRHPFGHGTRARHRGPRGRRQPPHRPSPRLAQPRR